MLNRIEYQGRFTRDIELKQTQSGISYAEFTLAWSEKYKEVESKCFLRCKAWRNTADFLSRFFSKGDQVLIEGRMQTEEWEKDGEKQSRTICIVDKVHFCGPAKKQEQGSYQAINDWVNVPDSDQEELPFD